jgi:hypothetical protein
MKNLIKTLSRAMAIAAVAAVLFSPMMVRNAMAQIVQSCESASQCASGACNGGYCAPLGTPEMSDYLAMAFVVVAGGMVYYFRRRALAKAK